MITGRIAFKRLKIHGRTVLQLAAIALVLLGAYNLLAVPALGLDRIALYPTGRFVIFKEGAYYIADVIAICGGSVLAWLV